MKQVEVSKIIEPIPTSDGVGVKLKRSIGTPLVNYFDPFLMLDEFGSENKDDYIGGFPPHPIEELKLLLICLMENLNMRIAQAQKERCLRVMFNG